MSDFQYDVFLSHSSKDKNVVRGIAERLRNDGLNVWFDKWEVKPGDNIPSKIEHGLESSRVLVLFMSANAFGSDWAQLESFTFRFRDPLNSSRRFLPVRLDDAPIKGSLGQFLYIDWRDRRREEYAKLLDACMPELSRSSGARAEPEIVGQFGRRNLHDCVLSTDGLRAITCGEGVEVWIPDAEQSEAFFDSPSMGPLVAEWNSDGTCALVGCRNGEIKRVKIRGKLAEADTLLGRQTAAVYCLAWSPDQRYAISGSVDETIVLWDVAATRPMRDLKGHAGTVFSAVWSPDQQQVLSGSRDTTVRVWDVERGTCVQRLEGHTGPVTSVAWSADQRLALSASFDETVRLWDLAEGRCLRVLEGHTGPVRSVAWITHQPYALSGSADNSVRLWDTRTGACIAVLRGHEAAILRVGWILQQDRAWSSDSEGNVYVWDVSRFVQQNVPLPDQVQYTNAKVLLVGDSGVGKTGLSKRLALDEWQVSDSTVGAWATHWRLPTSSEGKGEREIWLWDFGGQADQRLIHQLYMEDTALAVLVFDGQKEGVFEALGQWDRDLTRASRKAFAKILAAGRIDAGGIRVSRQQIEAFAKERDFVCFLETSAKTNVGCEELRKAILDGIRWEDIPWRTSPALFKRLKEEILLLKDEGRVLMRFNELRDSLRLRLSGKDSQFKDEELRAVVGLLAGPGVVWELEFGSWILLQPERINAYAQAVIQTLREDEQERGAIAEERVLRGDISYQSTASRLNSEEERFVLLAMHQTLVERNLCLREHTEKGPLLVFPSYYRRERPELIGHPAVLVSYRFNGFLDDVYATLVVRLHHTHPFQQDQLWRYAADFKTLTGKTLGVKLTRRAEGAGELEVYFDPAIPLEEKIIFTRYVHEHMLQKGRDVVRLRHYVCPHCGTPVGSRDVAMRRLEGWLEKEAENKTGSVWRAWLSKSTLPSVICTECEERVPLWDDMEQRFASPETQGRVRQLQEQSALVLDNESKERALVGEVISTVALAGQISREFTVSDHGIDMEIEFRSDDGEPTGKKLYLQLKLEASYAPKSFDKNALRIRRPRDAEYWIAQVFPVMLVMRTADGDVFWMEVSDWLKRRSGIEHIIFAGTRFDVMSVRRWRETLLLGRRSPLSPPLEQ